ncbi:hypothetical protein COB55_02660 [Candidatus Wolfebacteria bacterium]|nr:MAG: hypothetical protein COB55_02660 [Candidatus Wolfebacteria bacterium]
MQWLGKLRRNGRIRSRKEIDPDEIFLDSSNLPEFNTFQFEGRFEQPISGRMLYSLVVFFVLVAILFTGRMWFLQIITGEAYAQQSENNRLRHTLIFAERGVVYDRNGLELAWNIPREDESFSDRSFFTKPGLAHILGYVKYPAKDSAGFYYENEYVGSDGVEKMFNTELQGKNGLRIVETNAIGDIVSKNIVRPPTNGMPVVLSIDAELQNIFYEAIRDLALDKDFDGGSAVVIDIDTGELLALTNYPEYDSGVLTQGDDRATIASYQNRRDTPFLNRAVSGMYTPGSIVKPFVAIGALREGIVSPEKNFFSSGSIEVPNPYDPDNPTIFNDWRAHGYVDMRRALAVSSNVYFYYIGGGFEEQKGLGILNIEKYMRMFGFGSTTGSDLLEEQPGIIPNPEWKSDNFDGEIWRVGDTYNTAIGQYGFQLTPLQAARGFAAIANKGVLVNPTLMKDAAVPEDVDRIDIDDNIFDVIHQGMRSAVLEGTAKGINMYDVKVAGKTGTAQRGRGNKYVNSWVVGFFPYDKPKYAFAVLMENGPVKNLVGATFVMRQAFDWMASNRMEEYFIVQ